MKSYITEGKVGITKVKNCKIYPSRRHSTLLNAGK